MRAEPAKSPGAPGAAAATRRRARGLRIAAEPGCREGRPRVRGARASGGTWRANGEAALFPGF